MTELSDVQQLHRAARLNDWETVQRLITAGTPVDVTVPADEVMTEYSVVYNGHTPLMVACLYGNKRIVDFLLENGADCNHKDGRGRTPLICAVLSQKVEIVRLLLATGSNRKMTDERGFNAAYWANKHGLSEIATLLREKV